MKARQRDWNQAAARAMRAVRARKRRRVLRGLLERHIEVEVIGQEVCPLMLRWTFADLGFVKAMIHYFPAEVSDRDPHDHPRSFVTVVLRGNYRDESWVHEAGGHDQFTSQIGRVVKERLHTGAFRYRPAEHLHIVETDEVGCWTLVVMGPIVRDWGFVRLTTGMWWDWGKYIQRFGGVTRCDAPPDRMGLFERGPASVILNHDPAEEYPVTNLKIVSEERKPHEIGDFVWVENAGLGPQQWAARIENISRETAWVRGVWDFKVRAVNVATIWPVPHGEEERHVREAYERRGKEIQDD